MNDRSVIFRLTILFVLLIESHILFSQQKVDNIEQSDYLPVDSLIYSYEQKNNLRIYYSPEWFNHKKLHISIINLPTEEFLQKLTEIGKCNLVILDSSSFVLSLQSAGVVPLIKSDINSVVLIGKIQEYGKYSKAIMRGKIIDGKNGESLPGARLYVNKLKTGAVSDKSGNYSLELPVGDHEIEIAYVGYESSVRKIKIVSEGNADFEIFEKSVNLSAVTITSNKSNQNISHTQMSLVKLDARSIKELPSTFGEVDVLKSIALLPGIQSSGELGTGFFVRGGGADQNLILLEDIPIFNSSHLFGLTSILNPDGISSVVLYKAGIPAKYGERASSVLDINMGSKNIEKTTVKGGIGLINSKINMDLPFAKQKGNLFIGGRTTYSDWLLHKMHDIELMKSSAGFSDLNGLLSYNLNGKNKVSVFGYYSKDKISIANAESFNYTNVLGSLRWNHIFNNNLFSSLVIGFSKYDYNMDDFDTLQRDETYKIRTSLLYQTLKYNVTYLPVKNHTVEFGINAVIYKENPGKLAPYDSLSLITPIKLASEKAFEYGLYVSDDLSITDKLGAEIGLRYSGYSNLGPASVYLYDPRIAKSEESIIDTVFYGTNKAIAQYSNFEPRLSLRYIINENNSVKLSYNRLNQYVNLVSNSTIMNPADIWKLSNNNVKPLKCDQYALGYYRNFKNNTIETSLEVYYKKLNNIIEYKDGASLIVNPTLDAQLLTAEGYNYGAELYIKKNNGRLNGWLTASYSTSQRRTSGKTDSEQVNKNEYFPSVYDKPINLNVVGNYQISRRWRFSWAFTYSTGRPVTLPEYKYNVGGNELIYYSERNEYRLPDYHRLDISITRDESLKIRKFWKGSWTLSIINLYSRRNLYSSYFERENSNYTLYALYIIGRPFPALTYNFTF